MEHIQGNHASPIEGLVKAGEHGRRLTTAGLVSAICIGFVGALFIFITPAMLALIAAQSSMDDAHLGYVAAWDINAMAAGMTASTFLLVRWNWRRALILALALIALGNVATAAAHDYRMIAIASCIAGLGQGLAVGFSFAALGRASNPDRAFSIYLVVGAVLSAALLYALPILQTEFAPSTIFLANALLTVAVGLSLPLFPNGQCDEDDIHGGGGIDWRVAITGLAAVALVFFAVGAVWSYAERIGAASQLSSAAIARGLSIGTLAGVVGAGLAGILPKRLSRFAPVLLGSLCIIVGFQMLAGRVGPVAYLVSIILILFGWNFVQPLLSGMCSDADARGRIVCAMAAIQTFGMGLGPAAAAPMIAGGSFAGAIWLAIGAMIAGLGFIVAETLLRGRHAKPA
jgi:predicted MFS family arabinose efflux permease